MTVLPWAEVLVGAGGRDWRTASQQRTVLVVVHTVTAATRLLDVLPLWSRDHRIQTAFTCTETSPFTTGTDDFLRQRGIIPISWAEAILRKFDLAIAASYGGALHALQAPLVVLPHGIGYNKLTPGTGNREPGTGNREPGTGNREPGTGNREPGTRNQEPVFGLAASSLMRAGEVVPSVAVLSHDEQRERLRAYCPEAVGASVIAGDPCFDRMLASRPLRECYRQRFGAQPGQRVVVVSSTWAETSLYGQDPTLVSRLARRLPLDEYRLVVVLHPNIWYAHTPWQVRNWADEWVRSGVMVLPPEEGWRAALVAADVTIGDHGSVTFYSAALGTPILLASRPLEAVDDASPIAQFLRAAPKIDPRADLHDQIEDVINGHDPARYDSITQHTTSLPGKSAAVLRSTVYSWLGMDEPVEPAEASAVPLPEVEDRPLRSQVVCVRLTSDNRATITRFPAESLRTPGHLPAEAVLVSTTDEPTRRWLEGSDILVHADVSPQPQRWIEATLARLPSAQLAATRAQNGHWTIAGVNLPPASFDAPVDLGPICAAFLHSWIAAGNRMQNLPDLVRFHIGQREIIVPVNKD